MTLLDMLNEKHGAYHKHLPLWDYYYRSYVGGHEYREGEFLRKYFAEDNAPTNVYRSRLDNTPFDNHVKTTIDVYRSFLFRNAPRRALGSLANNPFVESWLEDVDLDGQGMNSFMKSALDWAMVYGNVWISVDKPQYQANTMAEDLIGDIRAYATVYAPQNVTNWKYSRAANGRMLLTYICIHEECGQETDTYKIWTPEFCIRAVAEKSEVHNEYTKIIEQEEFQNPLGYVPFINLTAQRTPVRGVGNSLIGDVADMSRSIYNKLSELEQNIRLSVHPTLVKTLETEAEGGAGAIITMDADLPADKNPYLLQPQGSSIEGILESIKNDVDAIDRMSHLTAVRTKRSSTTSGVALQTERQLLNSMLSDLSDTISEAELKLWRIWLDWQGMDFTPEFEIEYSKSFDIRDNHLDIELLSRAMSLVPNADFHKLAQVEIAKIVFEDEQDLQFVLDSLESQEETIVIQEPLPNPSDDDS